MVKYVNTETFQKEILKEKKVKQCVIEVYKDHCPACFISKFNTNIISRKMYKHGLLDNIPFYRMKISNQIPWLGDIPHTPLHLFVRLEGEDIVEMKLLDSPLQQEKTDNFLKQISELGGFSKLDDTIKIDVIEQRTRHIKMQDLDLNYDFDFDAAKDYTSKHAKKPEE